MILQFLLEIFCKIRKQLDLITFSVIGYKNGVLPKDAFMLCLLKAAKLLPKPKNP